MRRLSTLAASFAVVLGLAGCDAIPGAARAAAKAYVRDHLVDPYSAKFSWVGETDQAVCGVVNAKNRMGAFAGRSPFIFDKGSAEVVLFDRPPTINDIRMLLHADAGREHSERWNEINTACEFPQRWRAECGPTRIQIPTDEQICTLWLREDNKALFDLAELR